MLVVFASSYLCIWNQKRTKNQLTRVLYQDFFAHILSLIRRIVRIRDVVVKYTKLRQVAH